MNPTNAELVADYRSSNGDAKKAMYGRFKQLGRDGAIAVNLLRASKNSGRAKQYGAGGIARLPTARKTIGEEELAGVRGARADGLTSGNEEIAWGGDAGTALLEELEVRAIARGSNFLITWPGPRVCRAHMKGRDVPRDCWWPLKSARIS